MRDALNAVEIQLVVKHLDVEHRAKQRIAIAEAAEIAHHLFGIVALMAAHFFQLVRGQLSGEIAERFSCGLIVHRQRQHVEHRPGRGQRGGAHAAHKDKPGGVIHPPAEATQPQRHQRKGQIGGAVLWMLAGQRVAKR